MVVSHVFETRVCFFRWKYRLFQKKVVPLHREFTTVPQSVDCFDF